MARAKKSEALAKATKVNGALFSFDPNDVWIAGIDDDADVDNHMVDDDKARHTKLDPALVKNIATNGVIQPVIIRLVEGYPVALDGRRRILHAREANVQRKAQGLEPLPVVCKLEEGGADANAQLRAITANSFREDHGPIAQARKAQRLLNAGMDKAEIADAMGISKSSLDNRIKLLELCADVQKAIESGKVGLMVGLELVGLEKEEQKAGLAKALEGGTRKGATQRAREGSGKDSKEESDTPERPKLSMVRKMLETEAIANVDENVVKALKWMCGEMSHTSIKGLAAAIKEANAPKTRKAPPKPEELAAE